MVNVYVIYLLVSLKVATNCFPLTDNSEENRYNCNIKITCEDFIKSSKRYLPHPHDCQMYYTCEKGTLAILKCESDKFFNEAKQKCVNAKKSRCIKKCQRCTQTLYCPNSSTSKYKQHPNSCQVYYRCKNGYPVIYECPDKFFFNVKKQKCVKDKHRKCQKSCRFEPEVKDIQYYLQMLNWSDITDSSMKNIIDNIKRYLKFNAVKELLAYIFSINRKSIRNGLGDNLKVNVSETQENFNADFENNNNSNVRTSTTNHAKLNKSKIIPTYSNELVQNFEGEGVARSTDSIDTINLNHSLEFVDTAEMISASSTMVNPLKTFSTALIEENVNKENLSSIIVEDEGQESKRTISPIERTIQKHTTQFDETIKPSQVLHDSKYSAERTMIMGNEENHSLISIDHFQSEDKGSTESKTSISSPTPEEDERKSKTTTSTIKNAIKELTTQLEEATNSEHTLTVSGSFTEGINIGNKKDNSPYFYEHFESDELNKESDKSEGVSKQMISERLTTQFEQITPSPQSLMDSNNYKEVITNIGNEENDLLTSADCSEREDQEVAKSENLKNILRRITKPDHRKITIIPITEEIIERSTTQYEETITSSEVLFGSNNFTEKTIDLGSKGKDLVSSTDRSESNDFYQETAQIEMTTDTLRLITKPGDIKITVIPTTEETIGRSTNVYDGATTVPQVLTGSNNFAERVTDLGNEEEYLPLFSDRLKSKEFYQEGTKIEITTDILRRIAKLDDIQITIIPTTEEITERPTSKYDETITSPQVITEPNNFTKRTTDLGNKGKDLLLSRDRVESIDVYQETAEIEITTDILRRISEPDEIKITIISTAEETIGRSTNEYDRATTSAPVVSELNNFTEQTTDLGNEEKNLLLYRDRLKNIDVYQETAEIEITTDILQPTSEFNQLQFEETIASSQVSVQLNNCTERKPEVGNEKMNDRLETDDFYHETPQTEMATNILQRITKPDDIKITIIPTTEEMTTSEYDEAVTPPKLLFGSNYFTEKTTDFDNDENDSFISADRLKNKSFYLETTENETLRRFTTPDNINITVIPTTERTIKRSTTQYDETVISTKVPFELNNSTKSSSDVGNEETYRLTSNDNIENKHLYQEAVQTKYMTDISQQTVEQDEEKISNISTTKKAIKSTEGTTVQDENKRTSLVTSDFTEGSKYTLKDTKKDNNFFTTNTEGPTEEQNSDDLTLSNKYNIFTHDTSTSRTTLYQTPKRF